MKEFYLDKKTEVLLTRYQEHAAHIRHLDNFDVKISGGFISIQIAFAGWLAAHPVQGAVVKVGLTVVNVSLLLTFIVIIVGSRIRRKEIVKVILNISEALGLDRSGTYLPNKPINSAYHPKPFGWYWWYAIGSSIGFVGTSLVLWYPPIQN